MNHLAKIALLSLVCLSSACDLFAHLDRRDVVYNDSVCQPNADGACW